MKKRLPKCREEFDRTSWSIVFLWYPNAVTLTCVKLSSICDNKLKLNSEELVQPQHYVEVIPNNIWGIWLPFSVSSCIFSLSTVMLPLSIPSLWQDCCLQMVFNAPWIEALCVFLSPPQMWSGHKVRSPLMDDWWEKQLKIFRAPPALKWERRPCWHLLQSLRHRISRSWAIHISNC